MEERLHGVPLVRVLRASLPSAVQPVGGGKASLGRWDGAAHVPGGYPRRMVRGELRCDGGHAVGGNGLVCEKTRPGLPVDGSRSRGGVLGATGAGGRAGELGALRPAGQR